MSYLQPKTISGFFVIAIVWLVGVSTSQTTSATPRAVALADNALPLSWGLEALTQNPAALTVGQSGSWDLRLFALSSGAQSNGFGFNDYRLYNGVTLSDADKNKILAKIPNDGFRLGAQADVSAIALRLGGFGLRFSGFGAARGNLDREILSLLFYGNQQDRKYISKLNSGEVAAAAELALSYSFRLTSYHGRPVYGGVTARLLRGLYYAELQTAEGTLQAGMSGVTGSGSAVATTAEGGSGFGLNWGGIIELGPRYYLAATLENAPAFINWSKQTESKTYEITFDGITAANFDDSLWVSDEKTTSRSSFTRYFPPRLRFGLGRTGQKLNVATVLSFGLADRLNVSTTPEWGVGGEYYPLAFLPLWAGFTVGGSDGFTSGLGAGLQLGAFQLAGGVRTAGGFWPTQGNGVTASIACDLHF